MTSNGILALNYTYMVQIQSQRRIHIGGERGASPPTAVVRRKFRHYRDSLRRVKPAEVDTELCPPQFQSGEK